MTPHLMNGAIEFQLNGKPVSLRTLGDRPLLWVLRSDLGLTGAKYGCGIGMCGACTVLVNKEAVRSCMLPVSEVAGKEVLTIEGLAAGDQLHPLQRAFIQHSALQCGFCTPGMILNAYGLVLANPNPTEADIIDAMDGNLCRCGAYSRIVQAVMDAAAEMRGGVQ